MAEFNVLSKGEYLRPQEPGQIGIERYLFVSEGGKNFLLLECRNNGQEKLIGISFSFTQYSAAGNAVSTRKHAERTDAGAGETFFCKLETDPACVDFSVEKMRAHFFAPVCGTEKEGGIVCPAEEESFSVTEKKKKYPLSVAILACVSFLLLIGFLAIHLVNFKTVNDTFSKSGVLYEFENGVKEEGSAVFVSGFTGRGEAVIPAEIDGHPVVSVRAYAFEGNIGLTGIRFEGSIRIENGAFANCSSLVTADLENVTEVGERAFYSCENLKEVRSSTLGSIEEDAFYNCGLLETVEIEGENRTLYVGDAAFGHCNSLRKIVLRPYFEYGGAPFRYCNPEEVYLNNYQYSGQTSDPSELQPLGALFNAGGFIAVKDLKSLHIGYMDCIPDRFSEGYFALESVTIGHLVSPVAGEYAFAGNEKLSALDIPALTAAGDYAFQNTAIDEFDCSELSSIGEYAFAESDIVTMDFSENDALTEIGAYAFYLCRELTTLVLPENLQTIRTGCFQNCYSLGAVDLPAGLKVMEDGAFANCSSLTEIVVPDGTESIGYRVFEDCGRLRSVTMPYLRHTKDDPARLYDFFGSDAGVLRAVSLTRETELAENAFTGFYGLREIFLPDTLVKIGEGAFYSCNSLVSTVIPDSVQEIGGGAFAGCSLLETLDLPFLGTSAEKNEPLSVLFTHNENFSPSPYLRSVKVRSGEEVPANAFLNCTQLEEVIYSGALRSIGEQAFCGCSNLSFFTLPASLGSIGENAFYQCYRLYEVKNESRLEIEVGSEEHGQIGKYALKIYGAGEQVPAREETDGWIFQTIDGIRYLVGYPTRNSLTLPQTTESYRVAPYLFFGDVQIQRVLSTGSAAEIGEGAFWTCASLTQLTLSEGVQKIGGRAFSSCGSLLRVVLPALLAEIGDSAFSSCPRLYEVWNLSALPVTAGSDGFGGVGKNAIYVYDSAEDESRVVYLSGNLFVKEAEEWTLVSTEQTGEIYLPPTVRSENANIASYTLGKAFGGNMITDLHIPNTVARVEAGAFDGCSALRSVYYAGTREEWEAIGGYTPSGCEMVFYE